MPLLSPSQIHKALKPVPRKTENLSGDQSLTDLLENASLSKEEILENLSSQMRSAETDSGKIKAAEIALKLHGLLNASDQVEVPHVTIVIQDSNFAVNPILIPRG